MTDKGANCCVALMSGGLDSTLAVKIMQLQGVDVLGLFFYTGFCLAEHRRRHLKPGQEAPRNEALRAGADLSAPIEIIDISEDYMGILLHPKHGYGSAVNPCIDCRIEMLKRARGHMEQRGARFIITGEVMGQRPMTQKAHQLKLIANESGCEDILLRPLSAKRLKPTLPEREGWVNREKLYGFQGRSRGGQISLARELGVEDYPQPAGGCCFLTDKNYARRLFDLYEHRERDSITRDDVMLLKAGRHFRLSADVKVIVGRDEGDNGFLEQYMKGRITMRAVDCMGPITLVEGSPSPQQLDMAARITARYGKGRDRRVVKIEYKSDAMEGAIEAPPEPGELEKWRI